MIEFSELKRCDDFYLVFYEDGSAKVARVVFIGMVPGMYDCDAVIARHIDTKQDYEVNDPCVLFRTKEEAERHAVLKALCDDSLVMFNLRRFSWFRNKIPAPSPPRVQAVDHIRPKRLASRRYRLRRLLRRFWWHPRLPGSP